MILPPLYPLIFGEKFEQAAIPAAILVTSKLVAALMAIFLFGLRTDHRFDKRTSLIYVWVAFFSVSANLFFIPKFGMYATASVNLASQMILLIILIRVSTQRMRNHRKINGPFPGLPID